MKTTLRNLFLIAAFLLQAATGLFAQALPAGQPEQDACDALTLCGRSFFTPYSYTGFGKIQEQTQNGPNAACFSESNAVWFRLKVATSGKISFTITPVNTTNDYDFAIFNVTGKTCDSIHAGTRVRCSGTDINHSPGGLTGLNDTGTLTVTGPGPGVPFIATINAVAGETYLLMVDNFNTVNVSGFTIDFSSSTATFESDGNPAYESFKKPDCDNGKGLIIRMDKRILCSSIAANGSDFRIDPPLASVTSAAGTNCSGMNGYTEEITLGFSNPLPPGNYTLWARTGSDGNTLLDLCETPQLLTDSMAFFVISSLIVDAGPDTTTCVGNTLQMQVAISGGGAQNQVQWSPATYLSNPSVANPVCAPASDITYVVTVTPGGRQDCAVSDSVRVTVLQGFDLLNGDTTICKGETVAMRTSGDSRYHYTWTPAAYLSDPFIPNPSATPDSSVSYILRASYPGCRDSMQAIAITVEPVPEVYAGNDTTLCYGDTLRLLPVIIPEAYSGYRYSWSPGRDLVAPTDKNPLFFARDTTHATLTVTTPNGCTGSGDIDIAVIAKDFLILSPDTAICPFDTIQLQVSGGTGYLWRPAGRISDTLDAEPYVYPSHTTVYTVFAINELNCRDTQSVQVEILPMPLVTLPDSARIYPGESYRMRPGGNCLYFQWSPVDGLDDPGRPDPLAMPVESTLYILTARTEWGCVSQDSIQIFVDNETLLDMPNAFSPGMQNNELKIIKRGMATLKYFRIFDRWGQKVYETTDIDQGWDGRLNGTLMPMGVYVYTIEAVTNTGRVFRKNGNVTLLR